MYVCMYVCVYTYIYIYIYIYICNARSDRVDVRNWVARPKLMLAFDGRFFPKTKDIPTLFPPRILSRADS